MVWCCPTMPKRGAARDRDAAVALVLAPGDERVHRRLEAEGGGVGGMSCTRPSVIRNAPATRSTRDVRQRRGQRAEQLGAVGFAVGLSGLDDADFQPLDLLQRIDAAAPAPWPSPGCACRSSGSGSCRSRRRRPRTTAPGPPREGGIGERQQDQRQRRDAHGGAARARQSGRSAAITTIAASAIHSTIGRNEGRERDAVLHALLPQAFDEGRHVDLIGLVVAGQRVHHDVDAGAEGEFALARLAGASAAASAGRRGRSPRRRRDRSR